MAKKPIEYVGDVEAEAEAEADAEAEEGDPMDEIIGILGVDEEDKEALRAALVALILEHME